MRRFGRLLAVVILGYALVAGEIPAAVAVPEPPRPYIVRLQPGPVAAEHLTRARSLGARMTQEYDAVFPGYAAQLTTAEVAALRSDPQVAWVLPDTPVSADAIQDDATWGIDRVDQRTGLSGSYTYGPTGAGVTAYLIDSGIARQHTDFTGRVDAGFSAIRDGHGTADCYGHGTHVAGTLAGTRYGVAKDALITPVRVLSCSGVGSDSQVIAGINWVIKNHAAGAPAIANLSLGTGSAVNDAVRALIADGVTTVIAAGNRSTNACTRSPAQVTEALTVAAVDRTDTEAAFSNYGPCVDLYAPGVGIVSADWRTTSGTLVYRGTSMATPHVAGAAAQILQARGAIAPDQVAAEILGKATVGAVRNARSANRLLFTGGGSTPAPLPLAAPAVTGVAKVGQLLSARTSSLPGAQIGYQWLRGATAIPGATQASYSPTAADQGAGLAVRVSATAADYLPAAEQTSAPVGPVQAAPAAGTFQPLAPYRILDTRVGLGLPGAVGPNQDGLLQVTGAGDVPPGASAVALNLTVVNPPAPGWVSAYPTDSTLPGTSSVTGVPGRTVPSLVVARLAGDGRLALRNGSIGSTHLVADVAGYWTGGRSSEPGSLAPLTPARLLDTRQTSPVPAYGSINLPIAGTDRVPADASAAVLTVTVAGARMPGYVTVHPAGTARPGTSTVNVAGSDVVSNTTIATLGRGGQISITNGGPSPVQVVVDLAGYIRGGSANLPGTYVALAPVRVLDTRPGQVGAQDSVAVPAPTPIPAQAVLANVTITNPAASGYATAYPGAVAPLASTVNFTAGQTVANAALVKTEAGRFQVRNGSPARIDVVADLSGYFR